MRRQHVCQCLHGIIKTHAFALVLKQCLQATEHQRRPARSQQQPGRMLLPGLNVLLGALLVEGGHGGENVCRWMN